MLRRFRRWSQKLAARFGILPLTAHEMSNRYDRQLTAVMRKCLRARSTCIDVGANSGSILHAMFYAAPEGKHLAFEPIPLLAANLREKFPQARVYTCALSDYSGESEFHYLRNCAAESGLIRTHSHTKNPQVDVVQVRVDTLDNIVDQSESISLIKVDAEGAEIPILRGGRETIRRCRPLIVFEAGCNTTSAYGIKTDDVFDCVTEDLGMYLSTMERWLKGRDPFTRAEFHASSRIEGPPFFGCPNFDFYFMAY